MFKYTKVREVKSPDRGTPESAGIDFYLPYEYDHIFVAPGESIKVKAGIKLILPTGYCLLMVNKSSLGAKGLVVGAQLVDEDYRGEVHLNLINTNNHESITFKGGDKMVQGILLPYPNSNPLEINDDEYEAHGTTERGDGGFGSTNI